jgi:prepilin-type N-terminal cleavage/methylation domain-containing protein
MQHHRRSAFTLIELLVVIAIIAILAAILFPVFAQAKVAAKKAVAISDMKQQVLAVHMYAADDDDKAPPRFRLNCGPGKGSDPTDGMSWELLSLPYIKTYQLYVSKMDALGKYNTPYGQVRRSYGGAANFFRGYQGCGNAYLPNAQVTPSMTYFPELSKTIMIGESRMLPPRNDSFVHESWAFDRIRGINNAVFENTRNSVQPPGNKIRPEWGFIATDYNKGSVWGMADGHAKWRSANGKTSDGASSGTEFPGYEHRAATWDRNGEQFPEWTGGMSCTDWDWTVPAAGQLEWGCLVPGESR